MSLGPDQGPAFPDELLLTIKIESSFHEIDPYNPRDCSPGRSAGSWLRSNLGENIAVTDDNQILSRHHEVAGHHDDDDCQLARYFDHHDNIESRDDVASSGAD